MNYLAFKKFLASSGLSTRRFGDQCGIGKSTVHRLAQPSHGGLTAPYVRRITPVVMDACRRHLESAGQAAGTVHRYLTEIFGDDFKPMINHRILLTPEVLEFFHLARDPFAPPRFACELFTTPAIESVYALLEQAVRFQGFVCLLAPVGAGKTMLKNRLLSGCTASDSLAVAEATRFRTEGGSPSERPPGRRRYPNPQSDSCTSPHVSKGESLTASNEIQGQRSKVKDQRSKPASIIISPRFADFSRLTAAGIVAYVLEELGVKPRRALVLAQKQLEQRLARLAQNNITVALCFDECHHLNDTLLTALKNFYELGTGGFERYLGLVLFGQPQFAARLSEPRFREIAERLACLELPAFSPSTAENYLAHCLDNARYETCQSPGSKVQCPKSETGSDLGPWTLDPGPSSNPRSPGSPPYEGGVAAASADGVVLSSNPQSEILNPRSPGSPPYEGGVVGGAAGSPSNPKLFTPEALRLILARASTPLGIANAASAAMLEAYKKGERCVLARFVGEDTGPRALRVLNQK